MIPHPGEPDIFPRPTTTADVDSSLPDPELNRPRLLIRYEELLEQHRPQPEAMPLTESELEHIRSDVYRELELDDDEVDLFTHSPAGFLQQMMEKMQEDDEDWPEVDDLSSPGETDGQAAGEALIHRLYKQLTKRLHPASWASRLICNILLSGFVFLIDLRAT
ncbi:hypothetical protein [Zobellella sp. DQSA1]|uniref:hypothetical protein n=1 Tax=Zobellella sp. DQSA1 TaxID=3342386 RepID=UPI0035BF4941